MLIDLQRPLEDIGIVEGTASWLSLADPWPGYNALPQ